MDIELKAARRQHQENAVIQAVLNLASTFAATTLAVRVPHTSPAVYIVVGEPDEIAASAASFPRYVACSAPCLAQQHASHLTTAEPSNLGRHNCVNNDETSRERGQAKNKRETGR